MRARRAGAPIDCSSASARAKWASATSASPAGEREHAEQAADGVEAHETGVHELGLVGREQVVQLLGAGLIAEVARDQRRGPDDAGPDLVLADAAEVPLGEPLEDRGRFGVAFELAERDAPQRGRAERGVVLGGDELDQLRDLAQPSLVAADREEQHAEVEAGIQVAGGLAEVGLLVVELPRPARSRRRAARARRG